MTARSNSDENGFVNIFVNNRGFCCRMRNLHYEKAFQTFAKIDVLEKENPHANREMLRQLEIFGRELRLASQYGNDAIRGLKRKKLKRYKHDKTYGVLEEEIVLCYFLEEMISSTDFLKKRLKTDTNIHVYRQRVRRYRSQSASQSSGFLSNILHSLDAISQADAVEMEKIIQIMRERYKIGNNLFAVILDKSGAESQSGLVPSE